MDQTPWAWLHKNIDGMAMAIFATVSAALISAFMRGVSATSILLSLAAAFMLTSFAVPVAAIYWSLAWPWWPAIGIGIGITSLSLMWILIRFVDRVQQRAPDIADKAIDRVAGSTAKSEGQP